eukprot:7169743-Prymnesium_polylepis.1
MHRCSHRTPGGSSVVGYFCFRLRDCAQYPQSLGAALAARGGTPSMPPWILPAHGLKTALAYASRVAFSSGGSTYSPGRSSPSSAGLATVPVVREGRRLRRLGPGPLRPALGGVVADARYDDAAAAAL